MGWIRKKKVSIELGEHTKHIWEHDTSQACKLACMHHMCLAEQGHISAKLGWIREIKVSRESGEHARPLWAYNLTQPHKPAYMHTIFLHVHTQILANFCQISMESWLFPICLDIFKVLWRGQTPQEETKALKNPSAGDRKRGPWEPQYSSIFIILVKSLSLMKLTLSYNSLMFFLLKIFPDLLK